MIRCIFAMLLWPALAAADETRATSVDTNKVAVVGFRATGVDETLVDNLTETFTTEAGKVPGFKIIGTSEIKDLVGYQAQQNMLGCDDAACMSDLAGALGVDLLVAGSVGKVGETFVVNVRIIDVKKAETKNRVGATIAGRVDALLPYIRLAAWQLLGVRAPDEVVAANDKAQKPEPPPAEVKAAEPKPAVAAAPAVAPAPPRRSDSGLSLARRIATGIAALGLIGGGALGGLSYWKAQGLGEAAQDVSGADVYDGPQTDAQRAVDFKNYGTISGIVGGVAMVAAIVLSILEPEASAAPVAPPTPTGVAASF